MEDFKAPSLLVESIIEFIKKGIISGRFKQGERLTETKLQRIFNVSRSPIREALRSLEREGFVVILPRKGAFVSRITDGELREMTVVRARLESLAAKLALPNMEDERIDRMERLLLKMGEEIRTCDLLSFTRTHYLFHGEFIEACGNRFLKGLLDKIREQYSRTRITEIYIRNFGIKAIDSHKAILEAFKRGDPSVVEEVVEKHILESLTF